MATVTSNDGSTGTIPEHNAQDMLDQIMAVTSAVPGMIYTFRMHPDGSMSMPFATPAIYDIFGVSPEEVAADFVTRGKLLHADDVARTHAAMYESAHTLLPWHQEFRVQHPAKGLRWVEGNATPVREPDGSILWRGYMQDITDRKLSDEALHDKNELLAAQQEASIDGILVVNTDFSISSMNSRFAHMWGLAQDVVDRKDHNEILELSKPKFIDPDAFSRGVQELYANPAGRSHDELPLKDGRIIERHSAPLYASDGQSRGRLWTFRDITEIRKAQRALFESERFARSASDALSAHIAILDGEGRILAINRSWNRFADENDATPACVMEGANYLSVCENVVGDERAQAVAFADGVRQVMAGLREEYALEYPCHSPTVKRWYVARVTRFAGDGPMRLVVAHENITDRVVAINKLRENQALLSEVGRIAKIGGWEIDLATGKKTWTEEVARIHGLVSDAPMELETALNFYVGESRIAMAEALKAACEDGISFDLELEFESASGTRKWARNIGHPEIKDGHVVRVLGSFQDITDKKEVELALRESEALFSTIFRTSPISINIFRLSDGRSIMVNDAYTALTGFSREEIVGHTASEVGLFPADRPARPIGEMIKAVGTDLEDAQIRSRSGEIRDVMASINAVTLSGEQAAIVVATDITDRKQAEAAMKELQQKLIHAQKMEAVGRLAGGVAHDFNNLLGVIIGNLDLLERRLVTDQASLKRVQTAQRAASRGAELARRMLVFSSHDPLRPKPIRVEDSVQTTIEFAAETLGPRISVATHFGLDLPLVMADAGQLENALLNVLVNARDAMPHGGKIVVTTQRITLGESNRELLDEGLKAGPYAAITISDSGEGMSPETLKRLFEPFYTTKMLGKGTGLGLSIIQGFFRQSGGAVRIESKLGYGTTVSCYLPFADPGFMPEPEKNHCPPEKTSGHETILLVDDEADLLDIASTYLTEIGYIVLCAANGPDALAVIAAHPEIAILVTDVIMPGGMNGAELAHQATLRLPNLKTIYASGFPADVLEQQKMSIKNGTLLHKPYQQSGLVSMVQTLLANHASAPPTTVAS